jgi:small subunit ribosomal protein S8
MSDPIADMITRVRNGQKANKIIVDCPSSNFKVSICKVLEECGFIEGHTIEGNGVKKVIKIKLKYFNGDPVINKIDKVSRPGLRIFKNKDELPQVQGG